MDRMPSSRFIAHRRRSRFHDNHLPRVWIARRILAVIRESCLRRGQARQIGTVRLLHLDSNPLRMAMLASRIRNCVGRSPRIG